MPSSRLFRFRLRTTLILFGAIGLALVFLQHWVRVPMKAGVISTAMCYARDWEKLTSSRIDDDPAAFQVCTFRSGSAEELLSKCAVRPVVRWMMAIPDSLGAPAGSSSIASFGGWRRPIDRPVDGELNASNIPASVVDSFQLSGSFEESWLPPRRVHIECKTTIKTAPYLRADGDGRQEVSTEQATRGRLQYSGAVDGSLIVFFKRIDGDLVQLIIVDVES